MSAPKTIRVTADHIEQGTPTCADRCPIALAIKEQLHLATCDDIYVDVGSADITFANGRNINATLPDAAAAFVDAFDSGEPVQPFEFEAKWVDGEGLPA